MESKEDTTYLVQRVLLGTKAEGRKEWVKQIHAVLLGTKLLFFNRNSYYWNYLIRSYTNILHSPSSSLILFSLMISSSSSLPDSYTLPISIKAASLLPSLRSGLQLHSLSFKLALHSHPHCHSSLITFYCRCGEFHHAHNLFDQTPPPSSSPSLVSFNSLISGLSQSGRAYEALRVFLRMRRTSSSSFDRFTMTSVFSACAATGDLDLAFQLHKYAFLLPHDDVLMRNSLVDMYAKCARMDLASLVFHRMMPLKDVSSWTCMIVGYAMHGLADQALDFFHRMTQAGVMPNHVTFIGVLTACVHGGKVEEGRYYFEMMKRRYGMTPQLPHYGCMVDMLGRVGLLKEAREVVEEQMPMEPNVVIWGCLMGACEKYADVEMGEWVAKHLRELEPWNDGVYVVLSNIYASRGLWDQVESLRRLMKHQKLSKLPAYSSN